MASAPANKIERAHQMYREGSYREALGFYTEALGMANAKPQKIALHSNRAACYLKLHDFKKAAEECTSVLELDHKHTGALMLRAQTLVTLKEYHSALFDVNRLMELNPSSEVYQNLYDRLKTQLSLAPIPEAEGELEEEDEDIDETELKIDEEDVQEEIKAEKIEKEEKDVMDTTAGRSVMLKFKDTIPDIAVRRNEKSGSEMAIPDSAAGRNERPESERSIPIAPQTTPISRESYEKNSQGWQAIPKPKGHSQLDYSRWDRVEDYSSDDDDDRDDDEDSKPQYRFRVRTIGVRPVK